MQPYDLLVFIGRFQPFHLGHLAVVRKGLASSRRVLVLAGSADRPRNIRDPFTAAERAETILASLSAEERQRVAVVPLRDAMYNDPVWIRNVQAAVFAHLAAVFPGDAVERLRLGLVGHSKDNSSYYLRLFPHWGAVNTDNHQGIGATELRELYFSADFDGAAASPEVVRLFAERLPPATLAFLQRFATTPAYRELKAEQDFVARYRAQFSDLKYPPSFNTADAVVVQSGHVLLVRRGARPGLGQLALPGGFIHPAETALDACLRELREETRLKVPEPVLRGSLSGKDLFDDPFRSTRGRTFTTAFRFDLRPDTELPRVKGGDDAREAFWLPLARVNPQEMFEDHYFILQKMVGL